MVQPDSSQPSLHNGLLKQVTAQSGVPIAPASFSASSIAAALAAVQADASELPQPRRRYGTPNQVTARPVTSAPASIKAPLTMAREKASKRPQPKGQDAFPKQVPGHSLPATSGIVVKYHIKSSGNVNKSAPVPGPSRKTYVPQFSKSTEMIMARMRGDTHAFASALDYANIPILGAPRSAATAPAPAEARPAVTSPSVTNFPRSSAARSSTSPATLRLDAVSKSYLSMGLLTNQTDLKRKLGDDDTSDASSLAEASDYGEGIKRKKPKATASSTPTTTKSGRHVLKPDTYDPAAEDNMRKRNQLGKRTAEQALCKLCTRMHSPANNQMVFCDGCNDAYHQRCHDPWVEDEIVKDPSMKWYCVRCAVNAKKPTLKQKMVSWPSGLQTRPFFSKLAHAQLVELLAQITDSHPDLPLFPVGSPAYQSTGAPNVRVLGLFAGASAEGLFRRSEANPTAPLNYVRKIPASIKKSTMSKARSGPGSLQSKAAAQAQSTRPRGHQLLPEEEDASFTKLWPKPGKGMYSRLVPDEDDDSQLVDDNDYNSFSVIRYAESGKKVEENGVRV